MPNFMRDGCKPPNKIKKIYLLVTPDYTLFTFALEAMFALSNHDFQNSHNKIKCRFYRGTLKNLEGKYS